MAGDDEEEGYFYLNPSTGEISTKKFLTDTNTKEFKVSALREHLQLKEHYSVLHEFNFECTALIFSQFEVTVTDSGIPQKSSSTEVVITVTRDEFAPSFVNAPYTAPFIPEDKEVGEVVFEVSGQDSDQKGQLRYNIIGDPPAPEFFDINEESGEITIKRNLMEDYAPYYMVCLHFQIKSTTKSL